MPLQANDVEVGNIAYFDHEVLLREPDLDRNDDGLDRPGPFVCVQIQGARSVWSAVTTTRNPKRLFIKREWRRGGDDQWRNSQQFLVDGLNTYLGPHEAFLRATAAERPFDPFVRPSITAEGVAAILAEIEKQGGPLLEEQPPPTAANAA